jgi:hypothetical protein
LKQIQTGLAEIIRVCSNRIMDKMILSKSVGGSKFTSNVAHTKPRKSNKGAGTGCVFKSVSKNKSPIGVIPISHALVQSHPGKATAKTKLSFCKWCGILVGSKQMYNNCNSTQSHSLSDLTQHETKTAIHRKNVERNLEFVNCIKCRTIHQVGPCPLAATQTGDDGSVTGDCE